jgi:hypothetical protein
VRATGLVVVLVLFAAGSAAAELRAPVPVSLEHGVASVRPGASTSEAERRWGVSLRPSYEVSPNCGPADIRGVPGVAGYVVFMPRDRFGAAFLSEGAVTGRGIRIGSTLPELKRAYRRLRREPNRFEPQGAYYVVRRRLAPHWEFRFDVDASKRVRRIVFGTRAAARLDEACA